MISVLHAALILQEMSFRLVFFSRRCKFFAEFSCYYVLEHYGFYLFFWFDRFRLCINKKKCFK